MKKSGLALALCLSLPLSAQAIGGRDYGWFGHVSLGGVLTTGNTDTSSINAALKETYRSKQWQHLIDLSVLDSRDKGRNTAQRYVANYRVTYKLYPDSHFFADVRFVVDEFSGYDRQVFQTFGYVHRLVDRLHDVFDVEIGAGLTQQRLDAGATEDSEVGRLGFNYIHEFEQGNQFSSDLIVLSGAENTYSQLRASLKTKIVGDLALEIGQTFQRNTRVDTGKRNTDTTTNVGLVYQF